MAMRERIEGERGLREIWLRERNGEWGKEGNLRAKREAGK
jgi:hypothetical protein